MGGIARVRPVWERGGRKEKWGRISDGVRQERILEDQKYELKYSCVGVLGWGNFQIVPDYWDGGGSYQSMWVTLVKIFNSGDMGSEETTSRSKTGTLLKGWGHQPSYIIFQKNCSCQKKLQGEKWSREQRNFKPEIRQSRDSSHGQALIPDTITNVILCLQTGTCHDCSLKGPTIG